MAVTLQHLQQARADVDETQYWPSHACPGVTLRMPLLPKTSGHAVPFPSCTEIFHDFSHMFLFKSLHSDFFMTFNIFFIWLFRDTHILFFFAFLLSRLFLHRSKKRYVFFYFRRLSRPDHIHKYFWGRQRHVLAFFGASTLQKMIGVSPSMRFFWGSDVPAAFRRVEVAS